MQVACGMLRTRGAGRTQTVQNMQRHAHFLSLGQRIKTNVLKKFGKSLGGPLGTRY